MISAIKLESFGKFKKARFTLGRITAFVGPNESGKSTIFDALVKGLSLPNAALTKRLKERYGESQEASLEFEGEPLKLDYDELTQLYAVGSGEIELKPPARGGWLEAVRESLYSDGIDPSLAAKALEDKIPRDGRSKATKERENLRKELARTEAELAVAMAEREKALARDEALAGDRSRLEQIEAERARLAAEIARLRTDSEAQAVARALREDRQALALVERLDALGDASRVAAANEAARAELAGLEAAVSRAATERARLSALSEAAVESLSEARAALAKERQAFERAAARAGTARSIRESLKAASEKPAIRRTRVWRPVAVAVSAACFVSAFVLFIAFPPESSLVFAGAALALSAAAALFWRKKVDSIDEGPLKEATERAKAEWRRATGLELAASDIVGIHAELGAEEGAERDARARLDEAQARLATAEEKAANAASLAEANEREAARAREVLRDWLAAHGALSVDEWLEAERAVAARRDEAARLGAEIDTRAAREGFTDRETYAHALRRRVAELEAKATAPELNPDDARMLNNRLKAAALELEKLDTERSELAARAAEGRGRIGEALAVLPERIASLERAREEASSKLVRLELEASAARIALELIEELKGDAESNLAALGDRIGELYGELAGGGRAVGMKGITVEDAVAQDSGGAMRELSSLSQGTRDAFVLAARLALADSVRPGGAPVLLFDDAFRSLDPGRVASLLRLVARRLEASDAQCVFFAKDESFVEALLEAMPQATVNRLSRVGLDGDGTRR